MPKDNEVDEKVTPVAWRYWNATPAAHVNILGPGQHEYIDAGKWHPDHAEPLYSAATVAELRARIEGLECAMEWVKAREEYLRGQVQRVIAVTEEFEGMTGAGYRYMAANIRAALTGADPT